MRELSFGTTKDRMAKYSEAGPDYIENMERLLKKFETAKLILPQPVRRPNNDVASNPTRKVLLCGAGTEDSWAHEGGSRG